MPLYSIRTLIVTAFGGVCTEAEVGLVEVTRAGLILQHPEYHQGGGFVPGTLASAASELRKTTNVLVACTNRRLIMISTGVAGGVREHVSIAYEGMEIVERARRYS